MERLKFYNVHIRNGKYYYLDDSYETMKYSNLPKLNVCSVFIYYDQCVCIDNNVELIM